MLSAPAKRASIFMFIISGLMFLCSVGILAESDPSNVPPAQAAQVQQAEQQLATMGMSFAVMLKIFTGIGVAMGLLFILLGVFVRGGGMVSVIFSIILCCIMVLGFGLFGLAAMAQGAAAGACIPGISSILVICALVFLFQAAGNAGRLAAYRSAYAMASYQAGSIQPGLNPSQQPQVWQQPGQWNQPNWPPPPPPSGQQNWPPPSNPA